MSIDSIGAVFDYTPFLARLAQAGLPRWADRLPEQIAAALAPERHGDLAHWRQALSQLPDYPVARVELDRSAVAVIGAQPLPAPEREALRATLMQLHPWRKGPFELFGLLIDTEWRSDWKWDRLKSHLAPLAGRRVLDIGCGSGYHCWRMRGAGAELVVGLEPTLVSVMQFHALQRYINDAAVGVLPLGIEQLPPKLRFFDTVFSMGLLYHRRSPFDHLLELREALRPGGQLVLETLIIEGRNGEVLVPEDRYARMRNVWFIPTVATLSQWLKRVGFHQVQCVNVTLTTVEEQRSTDWMTFESLASQLDALAPQLTIEGYPAPRRAVLIAEAP